MLIRTCSALIIYEDCMAMGSYEVLLHKHPKFGMWMGPGGKLNDNECEVEALIREVREETGLDITKFVRKDDEIIDYQRTRIRKPDDIVYMKLDNGDVLVDHTYFIKVDQKIRQQKLKKESEEIEMKWIDTYEDVHLDMFNDTREQLEMIRQLYG